MALNLMSLLQQMSGAVPNPQDTIEVTAQQQPQTQGNGLGPIPPDMANRAYLEEAAQANNLPLSEEVQQQRRGLFGTRGTLRNVLGTLGDAFLTANGGEAQYAPQRDRERLSDAMVGYTNSPEAAMAAVERVTQIDPAAGRALFEQIQADELRRSQIEGTRANQQSQAQSRGWDDYKDLRNYAARTLQAVETPEDFQYAMTVIGSMAQRAGVTLEELGITQNMTPEQRAVYAGGDMTVNQQVQVPFTEQRIGISQQNADANTRNSMRPRAAPQPRAQTALEYYQELSSIPARERTAEQQTWMDNQVGMDDTRPSRPASSRRTATPRRLVMPRGN